MAAQAVPGEICSIATSNNRLLFFLVEFERQCRDLLVREQIVLVAHSKCRLAAPDFGVDAGRFGKRRNQRLDAFPIRLYCRALP